MIPPPKDTTMNDAPPPPSRPSDDAQPRCARCRHHYITHDVRFPYGCRALGFKSRSEPCREVLAASGEPCAYFERKA